MRTFTFPNGGHSVRKLVNELMKHPDMRCNIIVRDNEVFDSNWEVYVDFTPKGKFIAHKIANKLKSMGTRFIVERRNTRYGPMYDWSFHHDFDDLLAYPEFYDVG